MNLDDYQTHALRTARRIDLEETGACADTLDILILTLGLTGEAGEVADYLKKVYGHGHALDLGKVKKELGDVLWYVAVLADSFGFTLEDVANANVAKLLERYPEGFSVHASVNRKEVAR